MFGLGMWEIVVIAIVALLFVGPDKLPDAAKKISSGIRDFRKQTRELSKTLDDDTEFGSAVRDLKSALRGDDFRMPPDRPRPKPPTPADDASKTASGTIEPKLEGDTDDDDEPADGEHRLPVLKTPADAVAKSDPVVPEPAEVSAATDPLAPDPTEPPGNEPDKAHG
jgi:sec-independent protein translocase protein TatB